MAEIPDHLLKRAQEARERQADGDETTPAITEEKSESKIPDHFTRTNCCGQGP